MKSFIFFFIFIPILSIILLSVNFILAPHKPYKEKKTPFECGYHSFLAQNRTQFTISFFIFALLFLLFDLEIVLIYPFGVSGVQNTTFGLFIMIAFTLILTVGFIFEIGKGALKIYSKQHVFYLEPKSVSNKYLFSTPLKSSILHFTSSYYKLCFYINREITDFLISPSLYIYNVLCWLIWVLIYGRILLCASYLIMISLCNVLFDEVMLYIICDFIFAEYYLLNMDPSGGGSGSGPESSGEGPSGGSGGNGPGGNEPPKSALYNLLKNLKDRSDSENQAKSSNQTNEQVTKRIPYKYKVLPDWHPKEVGVTSEGDKVFVHETCRPKSEIPDCKQQYQIRGLERGWHIIGTSSAAFKIGPSGAESGPWAILDLSVRKDNYSDMDKDLVNVLEHLRDYHGRVAIHQSNVADQGLWTYIKFKRPEVTADKIVLSKGFLDDMRKEGFPYTKK